MAKVKSMKAFNPDGRYVWEPEDEFVLNGQEFSFLFNMLKEITLGKGVYPAQAYVNAYEFMLEKLKAGYEQGVIKELEEPTAKVVEAEPENKKAKK